MEPTTKPKGYELPDLREKAVNPKGDTQISEKRLFLQLQVYTGCPDPKPLAEALKASGLESVLYLDVNDPRGVAVLAMSEDPALFAGPFRDLQNRAPFASLTRRPELTMIGRTYATGREPNLDYMLLKKPRQTALNPDWPWAVWYPLRRKPTFAVLEPAEQGKILYEHATIGMAFGAADAAHDIRVSCYGLDQDDNEFVIGLIGKDLTPLSQCVQEMRKTQQTAKYIKKLGPFFVGKVFWQSALAT
ncbi:MAG TPA: chlorite dismutase family protein [Planctomycetota bacterium]|nr:chlorite dismutase family protein [Planctomycetota bacterium]